MDIYEGLLYTMTKPNDNKYLTEAKVPTMVINMLAPEIVERIKPQIDDPEIFPKLMAEDINMNFTLMQAIQSGNAGRIIQKMIESSSGLHSIAREKMREEYSNYVLRAIKGTSVTVDIREITDKLLVDMALMSLSGVESQESVNLFGADFNIKFSEETLERAKVLAAELYSTQKKTP